MEFEKLLEILLSNPDTANQIVKSTIGKYKPALYSIGSELLGIYSDFVKNDDTYATVATDKKKMFDAYVNVGFSEDQAMALIINNNINRINAIKEARK